MTLRSIRILLFLLGFGLNPVMGFSQEKPRTILDYVDPNVQQEVEAILSHPNLTTSSSEETFSVHPEVYDWLLDHPDRASLAWRRMDFPCVPITRPSEKTFCWKDEDGSCVTWQIVARFRDGVVWLAEGVIKRGTLLPAVPIRAVAILHAPRTVTQEGHVTITPSIRVYATTESRAAIAIMKIMGSAAPHLARQGADQLLLFFSGPARYLYRHPEKITALLGVEREGTVSPTAHSSFTR